LQGVEAVNIDVIGALATELAGARRAEVQKKKKKKKTYKRIVAAKY
jgi:hypothetical protein